MDEKINVKFKTFGMEIKVSASTSETASELIMDFFKIKNINKEKVLGKIEFELDSTGKKIDIESNEKLSDLGIIDGSIIIVLDHGNIFSTQPEKKRTKRADEKKLLLTKEETKEPETMLSVAREMAIFGYIESEKILKDKCDKEHEYISVDEALELKEQDEHGFILGLMGKYLKNLEMSVAINLNEHGQDKNTRNASHSTLQFLSNGLITKRRTNLIFDADQNFLAHVNQDKIKNRQFNDSLRDLLIKEFSELKKETTVFTNYPIRDKFKAMLITLREQDIDITDSRLERAFRYQNDLAEKEIDYEEDIPLMEGIVLTKSFLSPQFDNKNWENNNEKRGNEKYIPPVGWWCYGVKCNYDDNDDWLSNDNRKGEWCIGYLGFRKQQETEKNVLLFENDDDIKHNGQKIGIGVYVYQSPEDMEKECEIIKYKKEEYLIGFMLRINPLKIRIPSKNQKYWIVDGTSMSLRPCGILVKKLK